jgi:hypothetical protein
MRIMIVRPYLVATAMSLLVGCTQYATLTVNTQPEGAFITETQSGASIGIAPVTISYVATEVAQHPTADGCYLVNGLEARWVSGVTASLETIKLCGLPVADFTISMNRDPKAPGLDKDMQFAVQVQSSRAKQRQAQASEAAAVAAILGATNTSNTTLSCTSRQIGDTVQTECK